MYVVELTFMPCPNKHKNIRLRHHVCNRNLENWKTYCFEVHAGVRQGYMVSDFFSLWRYIRPNNEKQEKCVKRGVLCT